MTGGRRTRPGTPPVRGIPSEFFSPFYLLTSLCSGFYTQFASEWDGSSWTEDGLEFIQCIPSAQSARICSDFYENISEQMGTLLFSRLSSARPFDLKYLTYSPNLFTWYVVFNSMVANLSVIVFFHDRLVRFFRDHWTTLKARVSVSAEK